MQSQSVPDGVLVSMSQSPVGFVWSLSGSTRLDESMPWPGGSCTHPVVAEAAP